MAQFILGSILLAFPFILLGFFKDKKKGFLYILFFVLIFHVLSGFIAQIFGIFSYVSAIVITVLADIGIAVFCWKIRERFNFKISSIDWVAFFVIVVSFICLWQVHYNYTGKINFATDQIVSYHQEKNMEYVYPYFSDEWYSVLLIEKSTEKSSLPLYGFNQEFFLNLEMFFHSFMAELMLILNFSPLYHYTLVSIFVNILIIILIYVFLRLNSISQTGSAVASLSALYIVSAANLPGIWNLIPMHMGIIFCLLGFCFMAFKKLIMAVLISLPVIVFYAPLFLFYALALAVFLVVEHKEKVKKHFLLIIWLAIFLLFFFPIAYIILLISPASGFAGFVVSKIFYTDFYGPNLVSMKIYNIVPILVLMFAFLGLTLAIKKQFWLVFVFLAGLGLWIFYSFSVFRFAIGFERTVFFVSLLIVVLCGFGIEWFESFIKNKYKNASSLLKTAKVGILILFVFLIPFYTQGESWKTITLTNINNGAVSYPKAPANKYLTDFDVEIFKNMKGKRFLSLPWKGTVIGVSTGNYPVITKEGIISMGKEQDYYLFVEADCKTKIQMAEAMNLDYVYSFEFDCPGFEKISESSERLILYSLE